MSGLGPPPPSELAPPSLAVFSEGTLLGAVPWAHFVQFWAPCL